MGCRNGHREWCQGSHLAGHAAEAPIEGKSLASLAPFEIPTKNDRCGPWVGADCVLSQRARAEVGQFRQPLRQPGRWLRELMTAGGRAAASSTCAQRSACGGCPLRRLPRGPAEHAHGVVIPRTLPGTAAREGCRVRSPGAARGKAVALDSAPRAKARRYLPPPSLSPSSTSASFLALRLVMYSSNFAFDGHCVCAPLSHC